jgi:NAD-dependent SIR2 family protein deacetylase
MTTSMAESLAAVSCVECHRKYRLGELWRLLFADIGEIAVYCPECAEREFGEAEQ